MNKQYLIFLVCIVFDTIFVNAWDLGVYSYFNILCIEATLVNFNLHKEKWWDCDLKCEAHIFDQKGLLNF